MRIRLWLFIVGVGAILLLPSAGVAATCNVTPGTPAASAKIRGSVTISWSWSGGCASNSPANTVAVQVTRPVAAGGGTISLGTFTFPAASVLWPTSAGSYPDAAGYAVTLTVAGTGAGNAQTVAGITVDNTAPVMAEGVAAPAPNGNGWNNAPVTVTWGCSDATSGVNSGASTLSVVKSTDGAGQTATGTCVDQSGNSVSSSVTGINIDRTAPAIALVSRTEANENGWNDGPVSLEWSCTDALSGAEAASVAQTVSSDGSNQSATGTCADLAGNTAGDSQDDINIDSADPVIALTSRTAANENGWNNTAVDLEWSCTDALAGPETATVTRSLGSDGAAQSAVGTCVDRAGNSASDTQSGINIDTAGPAITFVSRTPANANGWNNGPVSLEWSCADALSGAADASVERTVSSDGAGQSATGTCADLAGNTAGDTQSGIDIDSADPVIALSFRTAANANGWNDGPVALAWDCSDDLSGPAAATSEGSVVTDGAGQSATGSCADLAGNTAQDTQAGINIDSVDPVIAFLSRTPANDNGWNDGAVALEWSCGDALSGPSAATTDVVVSDEGAGQSATGTCADLAGNTAQNEQSGINIDLTDPIVTFVARTPSGDAGWNAGPVTVEWSCEDALSGVAAESVEQTVSTDGAGQSATGTCADRAGNTASDSQGDINIDSADPTIALLSRTAANAHGWNNGPVVVEWSCEDALSGAAAASVDASITGEGASQTATGTCTDLAGNSAQASEDEIHIDLTDPSIELISRTPANEHGWNAEPVSLQWACADVLSGAANAGDSAIVETDGFDQAATGACSDRAGNTATDAQDAINIDRAAPGMSLLARTPANADGWNRTDVEIMWSCADALSGPAASLATASVTLEGAGQSAEGSCADRAGNVATATVAGINIDKTAPSAAIADSAVYLRLLRQRMTITGVDTLSGVKSMKVTFTNLLGASQTLDAACLAGCGTTAATFEVNLAGLSGSGLFTATAEATDVAGNAGVSSTPVTALIV